MLDYVHIIKFLFLIIIIDSIFQSWKDPGFWRLFRFMEFTVDGLEFVKGKKKLWIAMSNTVQKYA